MITPKEELEQHLAQMSANDPDTMRDLPSAISGAKWLANKLLRLAAEDAPKPSKARVTGDQIQEILHGL